MSENVDLALLARLSPGYVAADIDALAREAAQEAIERISSIANQNQEFDESWKKWINRFDCSDENMDKISIAFEDFTKALRTFQTFFSSFQEFSGILGIFGFSLFFQIFPDFFGIFQNFPEFSRILEFY